jgi:predicted ATP-grasp superfamily ATP-dependent carboligase
MRIFVGEYVCGGGLAEQPLEQIPESLRQEGAAMLRAVVSDLSEFANTVVPVDPRFDLDVDAEHRVELNRTDAILGQWVAAARGCDSALIIAPESDGVLAQSVAMLRAGGIDVIAGSGDFLRVASDKLLTAKTLAAAGVPQPPYLALSDRRGQVGLESYDQFVVKPRDGCGTQKIKRFTSLDDARAELDEDQILQAWLPGRAVSIATIASATAQVYLPAVSQNLCDSNCSYAGGQGPLDDEDQRRATALASRAIAAMPPTVRGFVGLDLVLGDRASEDFVIEINPRLTTSYVGLRRMIKGNLATRFFDLESGPLSCCTSVNAVRWTPDGQVWINDTVAESA